jgi:uncharacterized caspase-like protein
VRWRWRLLLGLALWCGLNADALAEKRVALVIGNSAYQHAARLPNPSNDASALAKLIKDLGFDVVDFRRDLGSIALRRAMREFSQQARGADIAIVFYAGHGIELNGGNYLVPTDAKLEQDFDVEDEAVPLERVLAAVEPAKRLRLVILDACRDNPFVKRMKRTVATRAIGQGLAKVEPTMSDTLIAFAARAGSIANDGDGPHSPFTAALLKHLSTPGLDVRLVFGRVRDDVMASTGRKQEPFVYGSLGGSDVALVPAPAAPPIPSPADIRRDYEIAERVGTLEAWDLFIGQYPTGFYTNLARVQRAKLLDAAVARQRANEEAERKQQETERAIAEVERRKTEGDARRRREEEERQAKAAEAEWQRVEREKAERARAEREKAEHEALARAEEERKARAAEAERQRVEREKAEREKAQRETFARAEEDRKARAAEAQRQRIEREKIEGEERARIELDKAQREELARIERERAERERTRREDVARAEKERSARERAEREKAAEVESPKTQVAVLPPAPEPAVRPQPTRAELALAIKKELKRVGCYAGKIDDSWSHQTLRSAVKQFAKYAKFSGAADAPSTDFLDAVRGSEPGICPLECGPRETERDGRCVAKTCPAGEVMKSNGRCVEKKSTHARDKQKAKPARVVKRPEGAHRGSKCFEHGGKVYC